MREETEGMRRETKLIRREMEKIEWDNEGMGEEIEEMRIRTKRMG
jgi:hypothetical protein